ncbi:MAG: prepilin-type N-terminal cleavage/methylation domain-containing protein [Oscillospiraceae bacterium]|nr:prepilin-type N-terminal cleavage/methylation domain-containing protein [Oscillospiraceae bacterium]
MKPKKLKNKKGFTLVELLVGFAIFSIISLALVGFITMSTRSYRRTSAQINLQIEYQITMTMLSEYIIDSNERLAYNSANNELHIDGYVFRFDNAENSLYLDNALVSRNVTDFSVKLDSDNLIAINMAFASLNRRYEAEQYIALRNNPEVFFE